MRILHVFETMPGGPATYFNETVPFQIDLFGQENIRTIVPATHVGHLKNVPLDSIATFKRSSRYRALPALASKIRSEVRRFKPDIIHAHSTFAGALARILGAVTKDFPPIVYCPHGWVFDMETLGPLKLPAQWAELALSPLCDSIVAISQHEYGRGQNIGIPADRMVVIENGISPMRPQFQPVDWNDSRTKVLFIGRLDKQKGVDILLRAATDLGKQATFKIIGAHVTTKNDLAKTLPDNVELLGWKSPQEITAYLHACDVVAMPSRWEGFGLVALEAMRSSKPVIASAVGGLQSVVKDGETGVLFPAGDHEALARAITSRDQQEWSKLGEAGHRRFMARYTSDRTSDQLLALYRKIVEKQSPAFRVLA
ncbi:glycosyltransferase family 4 protein [Agrobacterium larrymoorei]|uniref:glycosyltransferase family 4 protein n=1 Tax=Agrobacterium larrymoorei TaxID=160699 RepID=UPI001573CDDD|nr:glycosyltransferase family 4 protein [Agrobacterium larrymoorei]NTJ44793.1 glycosyltransferase family 4 protein [Agrobacterium larrymoorei]